MQDWLTLDRRPTLVFGAGGLGGACALSLAAQGARVALVDVNQDKLDAVVRAAKEAGCEIKPLVADLRTAEACRAAVREGVELVGTPQVFLHAIGRNERKAILDLGDADWEDTLSLNLSSAYWLGQAVGRLMVEQRYGRMVFVSSVSGLLAHPHHGPYAATKGGMNQMLRVMAREWARHGVTVNAVAPGYIGTEMVRAIAPEVLEKRILPLIPTGRLGEPEEVARCVVFLASDAAAFITGSTLTVNGGQYMA